MNMTSGTAIKMALHGVGTVTNPPRDGEQGAAPDVPTTTDVKPEEQP